MGEIRFVGTGETHGYLYLVCKKLHYVTEIISSALQQTHRECKYLSLFMSSDIFQHSFRTHDLTKYSLINYKLQFIRALLVINKRY